VYQPIVPDGSGRLISQVLDLALVRWQGVWKGVETTWLRWESLDGGLLLTPGEAEYLRAEQEYLRAEQEYLRAEQEAAKVRQIARHLLQTGMALEQVCQMMGLGLEELG